MVTEIAAWIIMALAYTFVFGPGLIAMLADDNSMKYLDAVQGALALAAITGGVALTATAIFWALKVITGDGS